MPAALMKKATMTADRTEASKLVDKAIAELRRIVDDHRRLRAEYAELWSGENRPFALEPVLARYDEMIGRYARPFGRGRRGQEVA